MRTAFLFAGQGAQYVGMGKSLHDANPKCREVYERATRALDYDISSICFEPNELIDKTEYTQPAIVTTSLAILEAVRAQGLLPEAAAGLSLGEYSALVCAEALRLEDAVRLVSKRGRFMQEAVPIGEGGMASILGLEREKVIEACQDASELGAVQPGNFNAPGQIVISGASAALERACAIAKDKGAKRVIPLKVSAPFHSKLLEPAAKALKLELDKVKFDRPSIPVYANVTAMPIGPDDDIRDLLVRQVVSPVLFEDTIVKMVKDGIEAFVEIGPGKVLSGFVRKTVPEALVVSVDSVESLAELEALK